MTATEVAELVFQLQTIDDLREVSEAVKLRWNEVQQREKRRFRVGQQVQFFDRYGDIQRGEVTKIMRKNVKVEVVEQGIPTHWTVSPGLLEVADYD